MTTTITDRARVATHALVDAAGVAWARGTLAQMQRRAEEEARGGNFDLAVVAAPAYRDAGGPWYQR